MSFEFYKQIMTDSNTCIRPKKSLTFTFDGNGNDGASRLFLTGETNISPYWKTESDYEVLYRRIDDSLRTDVANRDRFCLELSGSCCQYPKIVYKKLVSPFRTPMFVLNDCSDNWRFGVSAKAVNLKVYGYLQVCVEVRYKKEGVDKYSTAEQPDDVFTINIPEGSYDWQTLRKDIVIDLENVANVCYYVEGENYEGELFVEAPYFTSANNFNLLGQFLPHTEDRATVNWVGQNLSHIEWIGLKVEINQKTIFDGEIFERCHRFSEAEIPVPAGIIRPGENTITFTCTSDYRDAAGYVLREWGFITEKTDFVISYPDSVALGKPFYVCVEGQKGDSVMIKSDSVTLVGDSVLKQDGLNALCFVCNIPANNVSININGEEIIIPRCVEREEDGVLTGTGDLIYIPVDDENFTNYLKWYFSQKIGNLLTIRPTYRWNGTRTYNKEQYRKLADILDSMGIYYSHMMDGRELPGCEANPLIEEIETNHFLGRQEHELDGVYVYWGTRDVTDKLSVQMYYDLFARMSRKYPDRVHRFIPENICFDGKRQHIFRMPDEPEDMQGAAERFIKSLRNTIKDHTRHTGPATLFKYFYQAGYKWAGAELMYSPTELTIASLRGANRVYGGKTGAHLAVQWSSSPHDTESRYRRYRLALFISYMQGIDEINTEEGLWRLEEYYNFHHRFSPACENHTIQQQDFYRYISTHTRRGKYYTPIAFLNGRYDGWRCFSRKEHTWGIEKFGFTDMEKAWDILTFFYPKSVMGSIYRHNCPDEEIGLYSGTPNGNVDILPIEAENYFDYRLLIASGYNKAEEQDMEKLKDFVTRGGVLLIGWPQLSVTVDRKAAVSCEHTYIDGKERIFTEDTYCGHPVSICEDTDFDSVFLYTDSHRPLVVVKKVGEGYVYFVNAKEYAGATAVELAYRETMDKLTKSCISKENIYAKGNRNIQFTVYENQNGSRDIYFIATDWHVKNPDGVGTLILSDAEYTIPVPLKYPVKVTAYGNCALYPENSENEVLSFDGNTARVQGVGVAKFILCKDGTYKDIFVDFSSQSVQEINI